VLKVKLADVARRQGKKTLEDAKSSIQSGPSRVDLPSGENAGILYFFANSGLILTIRDPKLVDRDVFCSGKGP